MHTKIGGGRSSPVTRTLALFLALILILGIMPIPAAAAGDTRTDIPNKVKVTSFPRIGVGVYDSELLPGTENVLHFITGNYNGTPKTFFCGYQGKKLAYGTWSVTKFPDGSNYAKHDGQYAAPYMIFADYYYSLGNPAPFQNAWVQACIWVVRNTSRATEYYKLLSATPEDVLAGNYDDLLRPVAKESIAAMEAATQKKYDKTLEWQLGNIQGVVASWLKREIQHLDYVIYERGSNYQPMILGIPPEDDPLVNDPTKVWLKVQKVDSKGQPLAGAEFGIYGDSNGEGAPIATIVTGADGYAYWSETLEEGKTSDTVYVKEITAPAGYQLDGNIRAAAMTAEANPNQQKALLVGGKALVNYSDPDDPNSPGGGSGTFRKVDQYGKGIGGAVFLIEGSAAGDGETAGPWQKIEKMSKENGEIPLQWVNPDLPDYIPPGTYMIREIAAPAGYRLTDEVREVQLFEDGSCTGDVIFRNEKFRTIKIIKQDETGKGLPGAVFEVERDGQNLGSITTGEDGTFVYEGKDGAGVLPGYYTFTEVSAPGGYMLPANPVHYLWLFDEDDTKEQYEIVAKNYEYADIEIMKYRAHTEQPLAGAVFEVKIDEHSLGTFKTNTDGKITITYETYGEFMEAGQDHWIVSVREVSSPDGHLLQDTDWHSARLEAGQKLATFSFENEPVPNLRILKRANGTNDALAGAVFKVSIDGEDIGTYETGPNGEIFITYEKYGQYIKDKNSDSWVVRVEEITAPDGYLIDQPSVQEVVLHKGETLKEFVFTDTKYPTIRILKLDANHPDKPLSGATFQVQFDGTNTLEVGPSDENGIVEIDYETYGKFLAKTDANGTPKTSWTVSIRETGAPDGYLLNKEATEWHIQELKQGQDLETFVFEDTEVPTIKIIKYDRETGARLPNTSFRIEIDGVEFGTRVTNEDGEIIIAYEEFEQYLDKQNWDNWTITVTELEMPEFYNKDKQDSSGDYTLTQQLKFGQALTIFEFKDTHFRDLRITKRDSSNTWTLADATFVLESIRLDHPKEDTTVRREGKTDKNGQLVFENLPNGTYRITETVPPTGYSLADPSSQIIEVTSHSDRVIDIEFLNALNRDF